MSDSPSFGAAFWDQRYGSAGSDFVFGTAPNDFLAACADQFPAGPILSLAEGEGRNAVFLASRGHTVTGIDLSAAGLAKAQQLATQKGVRITTAVADLRDYAFGGATWSGIVSIFCHLPPPLRKVVHARAAAGLRLGGVVVLEAYAPDQVNHRTGGPIAAPELLMRLAEVRDEFPGITWIIAREVERDVVEGTGHTGRAAVVQLCGRRVR